MAWVRQWMRRMEDDEANKQDWQLRLWRDALRAASLGWDLALPMFGGVLLGHVLDRWLGTGYVWTLGLLVLGIGTGFYNVLRYAKRLDARRARPASEEDHTDEAKG